MSENAAALKRERIIAGETQLLRPIIDAWHKDGVIDPQAFNLSSADRKDFNRLSVARSEVTSAEQAYTDRANAIRDRCWASGKPYRPPAGVLAITVEEVESVEIKLAEGSRMPLTAWDDSMNADRPDDHGHIDFDDVPASDKGACLWVAKAMLARAQRRGWQFRVAESAEEL